jgi:hypothetical protein
VKAEQEAKAKAEVEEEARVNAEQEARVKAEQEAKAKAEEETRIKAEDEATVKAEQEAKAKAEIEEEARIKAEDEAIAKAEEEARVNAEQEARVKAEQEAEEEVRVEAEQEAKTKADEETRIKAEEEEARVKAEEEAKAKAEVEIEEEARIKAKDEAKAKAKEEARIKLEQEARLKAEQEANIKAEAEEEARIKAEETRAKAEQEAKVKAEEEEETEPKAVEEIVAVGETRISELERLEREFGLIDPPLKSDDKAGEQVVPGTGYFFTESRKVDSKSYGERSSETLEKSKQKYNQIEKQQTEVTVRLVELERLRHNKLKRVEKSNMEGVEDLEQTTSEDSRFLEEITHDWEKSQVEEVVTSPKHNLVDDEAMKLADTITKSDKLYIPSKKVLASTPFLMKEVAGASLENYSGKEGLFSERDVGVHAGNTLKVPVRVSIPGSIVEFSIEKRSYDFSFGINAFLDEGQAVKIKVCETKKAFSEVFIKYQV